MKNKNYLFSFPSLLFLIGLGLVFLSPSKTNASTLFYDTGSNLTNSQLFNGWAGIKMFPSSSANNQALVVDGIDLVLERGGTGSIWTANIGYSMNNSGNVTSSDNADIIWMATSTGFLSEVSSTLSWFHISFGDGISFPLGANLFTRFYHGTSSFSSKIGNNGVSAGVLGQCTNNSCAYDRQADFRLYTKSTSGTGTIRFGFPEDGLETTGFTNWVFSLSELDPYHTYYIFVDTDFVTSTSPVDDSLKYTHHDVSTLTGSEEARLWAFPKHEGITEFYNASTAITWESVVRLCYDQYCFVPLGTDTIQFTVPGDIPFTAYSSLAAPFLTTDDFAYDRYGNKIPSWLLPSNLMGTSTSMCDIGSSTSWVDYLQNFGCRAIEVSLVPSTSSLNYFIGVLDGTKRLFPFKYFFETADIAKSGIASASSTSPSLTFTMPFANEDEDFTITLLSSSTLSDITTPTQKDQIFAVARYLIWGSVLATILMSFL